MRARNILVALLTATAALLASAPATATDGNGDGKQNFTIKSVVASECVPFMDTGLIELTITMGSVEEGISFNLNGTQPAGAAYIPPNTTQTVVVDAVWAGRNQTVIATGGDTGDTDTATFDAPRCVQPERQNYFLPGHRNGHWAVHVTNPVFVDDKLSPTTRAMTCAVKLDGGEWSAKQRIADGNTKAFHYRGLERGTYSGKVRCNVYYRVRPFAFKVQPTPGVAPAASAKQVAAHKVRAVLDSTATNVRLSYQVWVVDASGQVLRKHTYWLDAGTKQTVAETGLPRGRSVLVRTQDATLASAKVS